MKKTSLHGPFRPLLLVALNLSIPAFYLILTAPTLFLRSVGSALYGLSALLISLDIGLQWRHAARGHIRWQEPFWDIVLFGGMLANAWPTALPWSEMEWLLRLAFCGIVAIRLSTLLMKWIVPHHLVQILGIAIALLALAGGGFYWLEPKVLTYADGLWLAFITGATVGYGDLVPSTHASRIFAVFIVLLGYAVFSVVTASIAALFVSEDEKRFEKELHADIRSLRHEIAVLREELLRSNGKKNSDS